MSENGEQSNQIDMSGVNSLLAALPLFSAKLTVATYGLGVLSDKLTVLERVNVTTKPEGNIIKNNPQEPPITQPTEAKRETNLNKSKDMPKSLATTMEASFDEKSPLFTLAKKLNKNSTFGKAINNIELPDVAKLSSLSKKSNDAAKNAMVESEGKFGKDSLITKAAGKFSKSSSFSGIAEKLGFGGESPEDVAGGESPEDVAGGESPEGVAGGESPEDDDRTSTTEAEFATKTAPQEVIITGLSPAANAALANILGDIVPRDEKSGEHKEGDEDTKKNRGIIGTLMESLKSGLGGVVGSVLKMGGQAIGGLMKTVAPAIGGLMKAAGPAAGILAAGAAGYMVGTAIDKKLGISKAVSGLVGSHIEKRDATDDIKKNLENYKTGLGDARLAELFGKNWAAMNGDAETDPISKAKWMNNAWSSAVKQRAAESHAGGVVETVAPEEAVSRATVVSRTESESGPISDITKPTVPPELPTPSVDAGLAAASIANVKNTERSVDAMSSGLDKLKTINEESTRAIVNAISENRPSSGGATLMPVGGGGGAQLPPSREGSAYDKAYEMRSRYWTSYTRGL